MLTKIRVVTFLLALVIGSFLFLEKAYAQTAVSPGGQPVCHADNCVAADSTDCTCQEACVFGLQSDSTSGSLCTTMGHVDCVSSCNNAEDVRICIDMCREALQQCLDTCI
jgi:hypothetical protein